MSASSVIETAPARARGMPAALELLKPITWFAPMWAFGCGVISSGVSASGHVWLIVGGVALAGPLVCGTSQAANDWFDRDVDAVNEPNRPIPSGRIPGNRGYHIALAWTAVSLLVAGLLGATVFVAAVIGLALAWGYSAPPMRLKLNGWWGNAACAACYEGLPWITGASVMIAGGLPSGRVFAMAALYSLGAHGIMTLNDFKSVEGDLQMGIGSLPARLGVRRAAQVACVAMAAPQVIVLWLLVSWGLFWATGIVAALLATQVFLMTKLLADPRGKAPWYNATGTSLYVLGMLACAFALRP